MHLYIMRHGETFWNKKGLIQGSSDIALTPYGEELARDTRDGFDREEIRFQRIYSSPYQRAVKTAEIIAEHQNISVKVDLRVREMCFGKYEGDKISEIRNSKDQNLIYCFSKPSMYVADETGDNFSDVYARIEDFLKNEILPLEQDPSVENVLVVCHGAVIRAFLTYIRQMSMDEFWSIHQPNCSVNCILVQDGTFHVEKENILYYDDPELTHRGIFIMPTWNSRGLRGSTLEEFINRTNERYRENHLALIQKVPTPITPIKMDKESRHITLAYFEQKSTVDYIGAVQGIPRLLRCKRMLCKNFYPFREHSSSSGGIYAGF